MDPLELGGFISCHEIGAGLHASGSTLDITAIVAFVGWTILELIVIWAVSIFRRKPA